MVLINDQSITNACATSVENENKIYVKISWLEGQLLFGTGVSFWLQYTNGDKVFILRLPYF